ncbi:MAG: 30S ribosomal protein S6 [Enterobacteriaceae bacterium]|nr:30S ribosomal protein S6 [Enterobacteriaceae bacterium]
MNNYEIMILIHPDQGERLQNMIKKYRSIIENDNGKIHRLEDLGKRQLAYQIKKLHKAHYVLLNVECEKKTLINLSSSFKFNDTIIRNLILKSTEAVSEPSILKKQN